MKNLTASALALSLISSIQSNASELNWSFKSPAFHYGNGYSTHVLSVEQLQHNRREDQRKDAEAEARRIERELENTILNKFMRNVESRIYAQLSKQLVDNMFGNEADVNSGSFELEGNLIDYNRGQQCDEDGICVDAIIMTIQDSEGSSTEIVIK